MIEESREFLAARKIDTEGLVLRYQEPQRVYHGLDHIEYMLRAVEEMVQRYSMGQATRLALHLATWYHDAIYEIGAKDNEERSGRLAAADLGCTPDSWVPNAIYKTKSHTNPNTMLDACIIDADLHGLGTDAYEENRLKVKAEYGDITDEQWRVGRLAFLDAYLSRPTLFYTSWGEQFETRARVNMLRERTSLT